MDKEPQLEMKEMLKEDLALAKDNHRMLRAIRRGQWLGFLGKILFYAIILALPLYLYQQYLQPLVSKFVPSSGVSATSTTGLFGLPSFADLQKLINSPKPK
jgi:hypothetical protein